MRTAPARGRQHIVVGERAIFACHRAQAITESVARVTLARRAGPAVAVPSVPVQALLEANGDRAWVFTFDPAQRTVQRVSVRTGRLVAARIEIVEGLQAGQQVVIDGAAFLDDGQTVRLADPALAGINGVGPL